MHAFVTKIKCLSLVPNCISVCSFFFFVKQRYLAGLIPWACCLLLLPSLNNYQYLYLWNRECNQSLHFFSGRFSWLNMIAFLWSFSHHEYYLSAEKSSCASCHHFFFSFLFAFCIIIFRWYLVVIEFNYLAHHDYSVLADYVPRNYCKQH